MRVVAVFFAVRRADEGVQILPAPGFLLLFGKRTLPDGEAGNGAFVFGDAVALLGEGLLLLLPGVVVGLLSCLQGGGVGVVRALGGEGGKAGGAVLLAGAQGEGLLVKRGGFAGKGFAGGGGQARGLPGGFVGEGYGSGCRCAVFHAPSPAPHEKGIRLFHGEPRALPRFAGEGFYRWFFRFRFPECQSGRWRGWFAAPTPTLPHGGGGIFACGFVGKGDGAQRGGEVLFFPVEGGLLVGEAAAQLFALLLVGGGAVFGLLQRAAGVFGGGFGGGDGALLGGFFAVGVALAEDDAAGGEGLCVGLL